MLRLAEEIMLLILDDESGEFARVPRWSLRCALSGGVLMDLALENRIDTDPERLFLIDSTPVGDDLLDPVLAGIAESIETYDTRYWVQHTGEHADRIRVRALERLVERGVLQHRNERFLWVFSSRRYFDPTDFGTPLWGSVADCGFIGGWSVSSCRAKELGYATGAVFLGTRHHAINITRVQRRVREGGHHIEASEVKRRWKAAWANLLETWDAFDTISVLDNSSTHPTEIARKTGTHLMIRTALSQWAKDMPTQIPQSARARSPALPATPTPAAKRSSSWASDSRTLGRGRGHIDDVLGTPVWARRNGRNCRLPGEVNPRPVIPQIGVVAEGTSGRRGATSR